MVTSHSDFNFPASPQELIIPIPLIVLPRFLAQHHNSELPIDTVNKNEQHIRPNRSRTFIVVSRACERLQNLLSWILPAWRLRFPAITNFKTTCSGGHRRHHLSTTPMPSITVVAASLTIVILAWFLTKPKVQGRQPLGPPGARFLNSSPVPRLDKS